MIVQPDFPEHWKTQLLEKITGDESAPMAVLCLWAHCQHNRRWKFPDMTPAQLASICYWKDRKPPCHIALTQAGFVDKLIPKGFAAHQWDEHNAQLIQKWHAGEKGGRPPKGEEANKDKPNEKSTDNRPTTGPEPDKTRPDQIRPDRPDQTRPDQTDQTPAVVPLTPKPDSPPTGRTDSDLGSFKVGSDGWTDGLTEGLASKMRALPFPKPTEQTVFTYLNCLFRGAGQYAKPFLKAMTKSHWRDRKGQPVQDWKAMAKEYANAAARNQINQA